MTASTEMDYSVNRSPLLHFLPFLQPENSCLNEPDKFGTDAKSEDLSERLHTIWLLTLLHSLSDMAGPSERTPGVW